MRWLQLFNACLLMTLTVTTWQCFAPIGNQISENYGVKLTVVNFLPSTLFITQIFFAWPISNLIERRGSSFAVMLGSALTTIGLCIKMLINYSFWTTLVGQCLCSFTFIII